MRPMDQCTEDRKAVARHAFERVFPWLAFGTVFIWTVGGRNLTTTLPAYVDTIETLFGVIWIDQTVMQGKSPWVYPLNYFPEGWRVASHVTGLLFHALLWPYYQLGGAAFATNMVVLLGCLLAFAGTYLFSRLYLNRWIAIVPALAFAFWGLRWQKVLDGHLNVFASSALLPWILWGIERALRSKQHAWRWLIFAGSAWALAFHITQYFSFMVGILAACWILLSPTVRRQSLTQKLVALAILGGTFLLLSVPWVVISLRETAIVDPPYYSFAEANVGSASLNSLPLPYLNHPWLGQLARSTYKGPLWENAIANFGTLTVIMAAVGAVLARKQRSWRPILVVIVVFIALSLGLTLHWDGQSVLAPVFRPLNLLLWRVGHVLKPDFFAGTQPPGWALDTVPMPSMVLAVLVPFFERGRALVRYALPAGLCVFLLAALTLSYIRFRWLQVALAILLVFEVFPPKLDVVPFPPPSHPVHEWLKQQALDGQGIIETYSGNPATLVPDISGGPLLATLYHGKPTAGGSAGVVPRYTVFLGEWMGRHPHAFWQPDFAQILRFYKIKYVFLELRTADEEGMWQEALVAETFKALDCFLPPGGISPWPWPICVVEVPPPPSPNFNVLWGDGWSGLEEWGLWGEGTESRTQWISTVGKAQRLLVSAFPQCLPDRFQSIEFEVNGTVLATHHWQDCEPWNATIDIPEELVRVGANDLVVHAGYASQPPSGGDSRALSAGFTKLLVEPADD